MVLKEIQQTAHTLASASEELTASSTTMASTAEAMTNQANTAAAGTEQASANVKTMAAGVEQISANSKTVAGASEQVSNNLQAVAAAVEQTSSNMNTIAITSERMTGAVNSVAGGGSLISFPSLVAYGESAIVANATNTAGIWPGSLSSALAYRRDTELHADLMAMLLVPSAARLDSRQARQVGFAPISLCRLNTDHRGLRRQCPKVTH